MKLAVLGIALVTLSFATVAEEPTDEQRCQEWAEMDGIAAEELGGYMKECLSSLNYEESVEAEAESSEEEVDYGVSQTTEQ